MHFCLITNPDHNDLISQSPAFHELHVVDSTATPLVALEEIKDETVVQEETKNVSQLYVPER